MEAKGKGWGGVPLFFYFDKAEWACLFRGCTRFFVQLEGEPTSKEHKHETSSERFSVFLVAARETKGLHIKELFGRNL